MCWKLRLWTSFRKQNTDIKHTLAEKKQKFRNLCSAHKQKKFQKEGTDKTEGKLLSNTGKFPRTQGKCLDLKDPQFPRKINGSPRPRHSCKTENTNPTEILNFLKPIPIKQLRNHHYK